MVKSNTSRLKKNRFIKKNLKTILLNPSISILKGIINLSDINSAEGVTSTSNSKKLNGQIINQLSSINLQNCQAADVDNLDESSDVQSSDNSDVSCDADYSSDDSSNSPVIEGCSQGVTIGIDDTWDKLSKRNDDIEKLKSWAITCNIKQLHLDQLLAILRANLLPELPKSAKTFLETREASYEIVLIAGVGDIVGEFVYLSLAKGLEECIASKIHSDGASPFRSSTKQMWPILAKVVHNPNIYEPFIVAIFYGDSKPGNVDNYLKQFIDELNILQEFGIEIDGKKYKIQLKHIICDVPARKYLKQIKGHTGYFACERCEVKGELNTDSSSKIKENDPKNKNKKKKIAGKNRVIFKEMTNVRRTDESFRQKKQQEHHTGTSPFLQVRKNCDMIFSFILDYMHLCLLGVVKKFYIMELIFNRSRVKLKPSLQQKLFIRFDYLKSYVPAEFQRKPRRPVPNLKATELRFLALYSGPIIFKGILDDEMYNHFLLLHSALRILSVNIMAQNFNSLAHTYLLEYVAKVPSIFGEKSMVLNVHSLIHLAEDVAIHQCTLNDMSAFPFESKLGDIRNQLRNASHPLAQVCQRQFEKSRTLFKPSVPSAFQILKSHLVNNVSYNIKIKYNNFIISKKVPNDILLLKTGKIIKIIDLGKTDKVENVTLTGLKWNAKNDIFDYPTKSSQLNMWELMKEPSETEIFLH